MKCQKSKIGADQMIHEEGYVFFFPVQTFHFAPNQKQTFFSLSGKGTSKTFFHITAFLSQFYPKTCYFLHFAEQTIFVITFY